MTAKVEAYLSLIGRSARKGRKRSTKRIKSGVGEVAVKRLTCMGQRIKRRGRVGRTRR